MPPTRNRPFSVGDASYGGSYNQKSATSEIDNFSARSYGEQVGQFRVYFAMTVGVGFN